MSAAGKPSTRYVLVVLLALACAAVLLIALPDNDRQGDEVCDGSVVASWSADEATTAEFARYGNDAARADDWTGGDGTHSVRLPDGRILWLFSDSYLGQVHQPPNLSGQPYPWRDAGAPFLRNSAVVMSPSGRLEQTLPAPLFPDPAPQQWRWPVAAQVEERSPGSPEQVVRVLLWTRASAPAPWIFGVPTATEVATLSLPDLRLEGVVRILDQNSVPDPSRRVLYGTTAVSEDGYTYVYGGNDGKAALRPASHAYLARVPGGRLAEPSAWRYWDGEGWSASSKKARPVLGDGKRKGVGSAFTVVRQDGTWVLFTMAAGTKGLRSISSYWACAPHGPWHGPTRDFEPPLPEDAAPEQDTAAYNPQIHPDLGGKGLALSYDVNWLDAAPRVAESHISRNVSLYRPRFVRLRLEPAP
ncbi:DUF4185 domain-containing protein [Streptomyces sp. YC504]|uniref:DUF4185 domain-containing protein n=1 Tax=Streptomyces mesophilus TaxID=1775132 RepID=A0A6G4XIF8_9ACTN|nr:DUF4185 domain-containing protein [Streptomyces mesophilus]NGO76421.1 DUF4185 domain-containing protein [Streptomyces mesophilus]